jgi:iron(III) transport system permease protein
MAEINSIQRQGLSPLSAAVRPAGRAGRRPLWLWIPALLTTGAMLAPLGYLLLRGLSAGEASWAWLLRVSTLEIIGRTLLLAFGVSLVSILLSVPMAWLTARSDLPFKRFWAIVAPLPLVIPSYVGAYLFVSALGPRGLVQGWLEPLTGIQRLPDIYGFWGALLVLSLLSYPFVYLPVRAVLHHMDRSTEEAARSLGKSPWSTFWSVTFPQLRPALASGSLLVSLYVLRDFGAVSILRYNTFTRSIYIQYQSSFDRASAALLALVLVSLTVVVLVLENRARSRTGQRMVSAQTVKPPRPVALGRWRFPALLLFSGVLLLALVLPSGILVYWLVRGMQAGEQIGNLWLPVRNSITAASLGSLAAVLAALPVAFLEVRYPGRLSRAVERLSYSAHALPGIVIALALVFFGANYLPWLYQTLSMLVLAYVILFVPQAVGAARASLLQIHPVLEEAGHSLGMGSFKVFVRVTLPLLWPGLASGAALVFLTVMKELPATLILSPTGFPTLATQTWSSVSEAFFARAAAPSLALILVSSVPMALLNLYTNRKG